MPVGVVDKTPRMAQSGKGAMLSIGGVKHWCDAALNPMQFQQGSGITYTPAFGWNDKETGAPIQKLVTAEINMQAAPPMVQPPQAPQGAAQATNVLQDTHVLPPIFSNVAGHLAASAPENPGLLHRWFDALRQELAKGTSREPGSDDEPGF